MSRTRHRSAAELATLNIEKNLGEIRLEEETLTDGSKVYNAHVPAQTIYCRTEIAAINLISQISDAIAAAK